jgi:hypothetical protein
MRALSASGAGCGRAGGSTWNTRLTAISCELGVSQERRPDRVEEAASGALVVRGDPSEPKAQQDVSPKSGERKLLPPRPAWNLPPSRSPPAQEGVRSLLFHALPPHTRWALRPLAIRPSTLAVPVEPSLRPVRTEPRLTWPVLHLDATWEPPLRPVRGKEGPWHQLVCEQPKIALKAFSSWPPAHAPARSSAHSRSTSPSCSTWNHTEGAAPA